MKADTRPQWLIDLDVVETTPEQARQIIKRNRALLRELKKAEPKLLKKEVPEGWRRTSRRGHEIDIGVGCPHCDIEADDCTSCAWWSYQTSNSVDCLSAIFDGLSHNDVSAMAPLFLCYESTSAALVLLKKLRGFKIQEIRDCISDIRKFLEAHITWGKDVIRRSKK